MSENGLNLIAHAIESSRKPITKKLSEILAENPKLRVWAVTRKTADCVLTWLWSDAMRNLEMTWFDGAWSCRLSSGVYQQIMVFVPEDD